VEFLAGKKTNPKSMRQFGSNPRASSLMSLPRERPLIAVGACVCLLVLVYIFQSGPSEDYSDAVFLKDESYYSRTNTWHFTVVADMDHNSKVLDEHGNVAYWRSYLRKGSLVRNPSTNMYTWNWESERIELKGALNEKGRGMELSFLVQFEGSLYTCDDRSGIVYELVDSTGAGKTNAVARYILMDGDGSGTKGFKCEWGTVKDGVLYIGSFGKEWEENGQIKNGNPMWVKTVDSDGVVEHVDWNAVFQQVRSVAGAKWPGYLFHEAVAWNPQLKRWYFLPRRMSTELYDPKIDESKGTNIMISLSEKFSHAEKFTIGSLDNPTRGFSCFKFIPGRRGEILAIKSEEVGDKTNTYITAFNLEGDILLPEQLIEQGLKYEGIEFTR